MTSVEDCSIYKLKYGMPTSIKCTCNYNVTPVYLASYLYSLVFIYMLMVLLVYLYSVGSVTRFPVERQYTL